MRRIALLTIAALAVLATSASAFDGTVGVRLGYKGFSGQGQWFEQQRSDFEDMEMGDYSTFTYGLEFLIPLSATIDLSFGIDYYNVNNKFFNNREYTAVTYVQLGQGLFVPQEETFQGFENEIELTMAPIHVFGMRYHPLKRDRVFSPFFGFDISATIWNYREEGTFIIFDPITLDDNGNPPLGQASLLALREKEVEHTDVSLTFDVSLGVEFYPAKNFIIAVWGRYSFGDGQINRQIDQLDTSNLPSNPNVPPALSDVFVNKYRTFSEVNFNSWETNISFRYRIKTGGE